MGLAVSDELRITAQPLPTWRRRGHQADLAHLERAVKDWEVNEVVVGFPKHLAGKVGRSAEKAERFAEQLERALSVPVILWDERYSTVAAERTLIEAGVNRERRRQVRDSVAALLILQSYLDHRGRGT